MKSASREGDEAALGQLREAMVGRVEGDLDAPVIGAWPERRHVRRVYGASVGTRGSAVDGGIVVGRGSVVVVISDGQRELDDLAGEQHVGVRHAVGLHDRLDREPVGSGDVEQGVAGLDLVEPGLRWSS